MERAMYDNVTRPLDALIPYAKNSRTHDDEQVAQIAGSIKEWGFTNPVLIDESDVIIAGHGRVLAARKLGLGEVPCVVLAGLSEEQKSAYVIADNKLALNAGWDMEMLSAQMQELDASGFDLSLIGFADTELQDLVAKPMEGLTDDDEVPDPPETPITVDGDVWILGNHRLMCGDSTSLDAVERLMGGAKADVCITSPPYCVGKTMDIDGNKSTKKKYLMFNDEMGSDEYVDFLASNLSVMMHVSNEVFYNIGLVEGNKREIFILVNKYLDAFKDIIYWKKSTAAPHITPGIINNIVELILCFGNGSRKFENAQFSQGTYWNVIESVNASGNKYSTIHKATFPIDLPENIITSFSPNGGVVIDSFGGTGTTLIACEKTNRNCYMMELDPIYCDVIINRWQDYTGKQAVHENGTPFPQKEVA